MSRRGKTPSPTRDTSVIGCTEREREIVNRRRALRVAIGPIVRFTREVTDLAEIREEVEERARSNRRGAMVYAIADLGGMESAALYATFIPATGLWRTA